MPGNGNGKHNHDDGEWIDWDMDRKINCVERNVRVVVVVVVVGGGGVGGGGGGGGGHAVPLFRAC